MSSTFQSIYIPDSQGDVTTSSKDYTNISGFNQDGITISGNGSTWLVELTVSEVEPSDDKVTVSFKIVADGNSESQAVAKAAVKGDKASDHHCIICRGLFTIGDDNQYTLYPQWEVSNDKATIASLSDVPAALMTVTLVDGVADETVSRS